MKGKQISSVCAVLFGFFIMGFCDIVGISSDYAKDAFGWSDTMAGFVPSMVFVWFLFFSVPVGVLMNRWGRKTMTMVSLIVTIVGMLIPLLRTSWACLAGYAFLGIGNAIMQVSLNPLLENLVTDRKMLTSSLTAGQVVKAVSSFCGPFIMLFAVQVLGGGNKENWYLAFPVLGAITLISALWLGFSSIPHEPVTADASGLSVSSGVNQTFSLLRNKSVFLLFLGIFFVVGIDVGTNFISSKIMIQRFAWDTTEAGVATQTYFISRTVGAFLGMFIMTKVSSVSYFRYNILLCIVAVLLLALVRNAVVDMVCIGGIGFLCSCVFPIIYSMALKAEPTKGNLISGLMITAVAGGGAVPPMIGLATDTFSDITAGVIILLLCAFYLTFCAYYKQSRDGMSGERA